LCGAGISLVNWGLDSSGDGQSSEVMESWYTLGMAAPAPLSAVLHVHVVVEVRGSANDVDLSAFEAGA
jgi:hypothetical protein